MKSALEFVHELLLAWDAESWPVEKYLAKLAKVFGAQSAGLAGSIDGTSLLRHGATAAGESLTSLEFPWNEMHNFLRQVRCSNAGVVALCLADGKGSILAASCEQEGILWAVWLTDDGQRAWSHAEHGALRLSALALVGLVATAAEQKRRQNWKNRAERQLRLENAATLVGRLAHDFNNVLTGIMGFTELGLAQIPEGAPAHQFLTEAYQAAEHGTKFIQQLSHFSKRSSPCGQATRFAWAATELQQRVRENLGHSLRVELDAPTQLPLLAIGQDSLRLILEHLLTNAREATAGKGTISLSAQVAELTGWDCLELLGNPSPGRFVEIRVADDGIGLSPEAQQRLFLEPFFSSKPRHRGMGLASIYGTLHAYRGGMRLDPGGEKGTVVRIYIPVAKAPDEAPSEGHPGKGKATGEKVLVVDDDPLTLHFMCSILERAGYRVHRATDGAQALDSFAEATEPFCLVLSDVVMPQMTGFDLAQRLLDRDPCVKVLFTSGQIPEGFMPESLAGRDFALLPKPFRTEGLLRAVQTALSRGPRRDASASSDQGVGKRP
ncbi:MAG TPA: response regulator [Gemmataceae bacterium]|nr:response regulator [Gemmataceae bacterium]